MQTTAQAVGGASEECKAPKERKNSTRDFPKR